MPEPDTDGKPAETIDSDQLVLEEPPLQEILIPTDGSGAVFEGIEPFKPILHCCDATVHVIHVTKDNFGALNRDRLRADPETEAQQSVEDFGEQLREEGLDVKTDVRVGMPKEMILEYATEQDIDLIVMVTHGQKGIKRLLLRSITEEVIRNSTTPVLAIRNEG